MRKLILLLLLPIFAHAQITPPIDATRYAVVAAITGTIIPGTIHQTTVGTAGTDSVVVKHSGAMAAISPTYFAPLASPSFTGAITFPTPFTLGATSVTSTGVQLNYLNAATGTTGTTSTNLVFSTSPTLTTPTLGAATATTINKVTITAPATSATLTIANSGSLIESGAFPLTLTSSATTNATFPSGTGTLAYLAGTNAWTGVNTMILKNIEAKASPSAVNASATLTAAQVQSGVTTSSTSAVAFTLPTATLLATQVGSAQGTTMFFTIDNSASTSLGAITLTLGSGMTSGLTPGLAIAIGKAQTYEVYFTSTTTCVVSQIL